MDDMRINVDGSPWKKLSMSFRPDPGQIADEAELTRLRDAVGRMAKGDIEFTGTEKPCVLHGPNVWRDIEFAVDAQGFLKADVYVCCKDFGDVIAKSLPQVEAFIKRKLKLPA